MEQHTRAWGDAALGAIPGGGPEAIAAMKALGVAAQVTGSVLGKVGAATGSVFLRVTNPIMQLRNYLASVGNVGSWESTVEAFTKARPSTAASTCW